jgi:archaeal flagellar protein FlaF
MAFASIISSAIGIILLIITAYVLVAGVLTTTQVAMNAQSDMTAIHMEMLGTSISIDSQSVENSSPNIVYLGLINSGSEPVDLSTINVFIKDQNSAPVLIPKGSIAGTWSISPEVKQWRPTETLNMSVRYSGTYPVIVQLTTGNGVSAITKVYAP